MGVKVFRSLPEPRNAVEKTSIKGTERGKLIRKRASVIKNRKAKEWVPKEA